MSAARIAELQRLADRGAVEADIVEQDAEALCQTMKTIHGGRWRVDVNHKARFVLVAWCGEEDA